MRIAPLNQIVFKRLDSTEKNKRIKEYLENEELKTTKNPTPKKQKTKKALLGAITATALALTPMTNLNAQEANKEKIENVSEKTPTAKKNILSLLGLSATTLGGMFALGNKLDKMEDEKSIKKIKKAAKIRRNKELQKIKENDIIPICHCCRSEVQTLEEQDKWRKRKEENAQHLAGLSIPPKTSRPKHISYEHKDIIITIEFLEKKRDSYKKMINDTLDTYSYLGKESADKIISEYQETIDKYNKEIEKYKKLLETK